MSLTLDEILQSAHRIYDGNVDYPTAGSEDYVTRVGVVNDYIRIWEAEPVLWQELFVLDHQLTTNGTSVIDLPSDFNKLVGEIKIDSKTYDFIKPEKRMEAVNNGLSFYTIYGTKSNKKLYIYPAPDSNLTLNIDYYKNATLLVNGTDTPELSDSMYLVYGLVSFLYAQDNRSDKQVEYENKATEILNKMIGDNEISPVGVVDQMDYYYNND